VALGWGLWEGPARFYFQGQVFCGPHNVHRLSARGAALTFKGSGLIYGTDDSPRFSVKITEQQLPLGTFRHSRRFTKLHAVAFFAFGLLRGWLP
jgi:hypothetical protein